MGEGLTPDQARGGRFVRTSSGLYVPADTDRDVVQQRVVEEAARLPPHAAVTGWAACLLNGAAWFDGLATDGITPLPVAVAVGPRGGVRRHDGITVSFERLPEWEVWTRYGIRVTRPERAVFDEMRRLDAREALVALESALAGRITSMERFGAFVETHRSARRSAVVTWALPRARGRARSPMEVRVRTVAEEDAGWPRLLVNRVVIAADGTRIGEVDLVDDEIEAVVEIDGADHRSGSRQAWDITKEEALRQAGFEVARVTGRQALDPPTLAPRLRAVRQRALEHESTTRRWRLEPENFDLDHWLAEREQTAMLWEQPVEFEAG